MNKPYKHTGGGKVSRLHKRPRLFIRSTPERETRRHAAPERPPIVPERELHVHQLLGTLRRRSVMIVMVTIFGALLACGATVLIPPKYTAKAQIAVEPDRTVASSSGLPVTGVDALAIDTQMTMLAARDHLRAVLASLADDPVFAKNPAKGAAKGSAKAAKSALGKQNALGAEGQKDPGFFAGLRQMATELFADDAPGQSAGVNLPSFEKFESTLRIDQERRSRVISVRYTSPVPERAAAIANRVVELYLQNQATGQRQFLKNELAELDTRIAKAEKSLQSSETAIRQKLAAAQNGGGQLSDAPVRKLQHKVSENAQLYVSLLARQKQIRSQQEASGASVSIVSMAHPPERPSSAGPAFLILPAIILSMLGGGVLAVLRERFDRTLRSEQQVHNALGIPCFALVPKLGWFHRAVPHDYLFENPFSPYAEAIRSIGASLRFERSRHGPQTVLVSSSVPGEGKTTLATSLAAYGTQLHGRVLLIDLDFRHPAVARMLNLENRRGILDLVGSRNTLDDIVQRVPRLGLDVLALGNCSVDPVTLFASGTLQKLINEVRRHYDFIVIDGPPLIGVTESGLLASLADTVLFVVKWGSTRRDVAQNAIGEFQALGWSDETIAENLRAVVTHVDPKAHASYRYGDAVEMFVKRPNYYTPAQPMKSLAVLRAEVDDDDDENTPVAAA